MEIVNLIFNIIVIVLICLVVFFTKNYLPSYMDKKGENLATKEDIEEITADYISDSHFRILFQCGDDGSGKLRQGSSSGYQR